MISLLSLLTFLFSISSFAANVETIQVLGCQSKQSSFYATVENSVHIQESYLSLYTPALQDRIINDHIEKQILYWIGISKQYHSAQIQKLAISKFRNNQFRKGSAINEIEVPALPAYWNPNVSIGSDPYILHLTKNNNGLKKFRKINYSVQLLFSFCTQSSTSTESIAVEMAKIPVPIDPYLGFWINERRERIVTKTLKGPVDDCLSNDFLIYGTSPEYAWFYWEPISRSRAACKITNTKLVTNFLIKNIKPVEPTSLNETQPKISTKKISATLVFGTVENPKNEKSTLSAKEFLRLVMAVNDRCKTQDSAQCMSYYSEFSNAPKTVRLEAGQFQLLIFLKYLNVLLDHPQIKISESDEKYFIANISGPSKSDRHDVDLKIYYGPTSLFKSLMAPKNYWKLLQDSFYNSDLVLYYGHAGLGKNLEFAEIEKQAGTKKKFKARLNDLYLGIFNCEGFSHFGHDLDKLFKNSYRKKNIVHFITTSGVEANVLFMLGYMEQILKKLNIEPNQFVKDFSPYIQSSDFLIYQKLSYTN